MDRPKGLPVLLAAIIPLDKRLCRTRCSHQPHSHRCVSCCGLLRWQHRAYLSHSHFRNHNTLWFAHKRYLFCLLQSVCWIRDYCTARWSQCREAPSCSCKQRCTLHNWPMCLLSSTCEGFEQRISCMRILITCWPTFVCEPQCSSMFESCCTVRGLKGMCVNHACWTPCTILLLGRTLLDRCCSNYRDYTDSL